MYSVTLSAVEGASGDSHTRDVLIQGRNCKASSFDVNFADMGIPSIMTQGLPHILHSVSI